MACSPALDWREVRLAGTGALALFPCKPIQEVRRVRLADADADMTLLSCQADGALWAFAHADVTDPARVGRALDELATASLRNIRASQSASAPGAVTGMTPNPSAMRMSAEGTRPDGTKVHVDTAVFAKGTHVFQATVVSPGADPAAVATFLDSVRWP